MSCIRLLNLFIFASSAFFYSLSIRLSLAIKSYSYLFLSVRYFFIAIAFAWALCWWDDFEVDGGGGVFKGLDVVPANALFMVIASTINS